MDAAFEAFLREGVTNTEFDGAAGGGMVDLAGFDETLAGMQDPLEGLSDGSLHGVDPTQGHYGLDQQRPQPQQQQQHQQQLQPRSKYEAAKQMGAMQQIQTGFGGAAPPANAQNISTYPTPVNSAPFVPAEQQTFMSPFPLASGTASFNPTPLMTHESFAELDEILFTPMLSPAMTPMGSTRMAANSQADTFGGWDVNQQLFALPDSTMDTNGAPAQQIQPQQFSASQQGVMQRQYQHIQQMPARLQTAHANTSVGEFSPVVGTPAGGRFAVPNEHIAKKQKVASISSRASSRQQSPATPVTGPLRGVGSANKRLEVLPRSNVVSPAPSEAISPASLGECGAIGHSDMAGDQAPITPAMLMHMKQQQQQAQLQTSPDLSGTSSAMQSPGATPRSKHAKTKSILPRVPALNGAKRAQDLSIKTDSMSSEATSDSGSMRSPMTLPPPATAASSAIRPRPLSMHAAAGKGGKPHNRSKSVTSSPALAPHNPARIKASPELRPILPGGMSPQLTAMLASKSNYQHIVDGTYDQLNISYPSNMTQGLETRRTSHKAAEQKRRDHLKESFEQLRNVLADRPDAGASKIVLLKRGYEQLVDQQRHLAQKDREIAKLRELLAQHNVAVPDFAPLPKAVASKAVKVAHEGESDEEDAMQVDADRKDGEENDAKDGDGHEGEGESASASASVSGSGTPTPTHAPRRSSVAVAVEPASGAASNGNGNAV